MMYSVFIFPSVASLLSSPKLPNNTILTTRGPSKVPIELIPPARFSRCAPLSGKPIATAKGWAAVCCREKPRAIVKKATSTIANVADSDVEMKAIPMAPITEISNP